MRKISVLTLPGRLGRQVAMAFFGIVLLMTLGLGMAFSLALRTAENRVLDESLRAELAHYLAEREGSRPLDGFSSRTTVIHVGAPNAGGQLPARLKALREGIHDVAYQERSYRVLIEEIGGARYAVQFDDTDIRDREKEFLGLVLSASFVVLMAAMLISVWLARRLTAPVAQLSADIDRLRAEPAASVDLSLYRDDEIGQLAGRLQHYHDQLQELLVREKEFAGNVSHELRTPITNIGIAAEVLVAKRGLGPKDRDRLQRIQRATKEMSELLDTFLALSQIDDDARGTEGYCELGPIIEEVVEHQRAWLNGKSVDVIVETLEDVSVPAPGRIVSVLVANLVRNAFRYTQTGTIHITLVAGRLTVEDTGLGIDVAVQERIFERGVQGHAGSKDGAGLGLAIVRRICERYGWTIGVESSVNQGSSFTVSF